MHIRSGDRAKKRALCWSASLRSADSAKPMMDLLGQLARLGAAVLRPLGQRAEANGFQLRRRLGAELARWDRLVFAHAAQYLVGVTPRERRLPGEDLIKNRSQAVDVRTGPDQLQMPGGLLRGHVGRRAERLP